MMCENAIYHLNLFHRLYKYQLILPSCREKERKGDVCTTSQETLLVENIFDTNANTCLSQTTHMNKYWSSLCPVLASHPLSCYKNLASELPFGSDFQDTIIVKIVQEIYFT